MSMTRLIDDIKRIWRGEQQPSLTWSCMFAAMCLLAATAIRYGMAHLRPDVFFTPYLPAVFFATAMGGSGVGLATAIAGAALGLTLDFGGGPADGARLALMAMYMVVALLVIWGVDHYRRLAAKQREIARRLTQEEQYRKLLVDELHHRLKNKTSTIHAVLHQVLYDQPQVWSRIDQRIRALATADDLIARADGQGCDLKDLLVSELGPYGHVRFELHGPPLFLPAKLAVSLALIFHELATNAGKYGAFASPRGFLQVSWTMQEDRLHLTWDEAAGPPIGPIGRPGFGSKLLKSVLSSFDGRTETRFLESGLHCTLQCRVPPS
ncbi:sensor histidine kinase [Bradyrhizobium sp. HKCCYLRH1073]|uniref:sensor histidine kinase n=1 Tax=unclassified Bradyrhizobium TaxID=2631580 RepID=UPI0028EDC6A9|nr:MULTISPECIES: sensor histidine kinase [unclassified Bradyrhizobium]